MSLATKIGGAFKGALDRYYRVPAAASPAAAQTVAQRQQELIALQRGWLEVEKLWRAEAIDSGDNVPRRLECEHLADTAREFHDCAVRFYSRWEIPE